MKTIIYKNFIADQEVCGRTTIEITTPTVKNIIGDLVAGDTEDDSLEGFSQQSKRDIIVIKK
jgi:uncharacterized protein (DUF433 family)